MGRRRDRGRPDDHLNQRARELSQWLLLANMVEFGRGAAAIRKPAGFNDMVGLPQANLWEAEVADRTARPHETRSSRASDGSN
jgi:hypothetical protein